MGKITIILRTLAGIILSALVLAPVQAAEYRIDPAHTFIEFEISHLGYSIVAGRFDKYSGQFSWDKSHPEKSRITIRISTASIDTNVPKRDEDVRSAAFLDVAKYPDATFTGTRYSGDAHGGTLEGKLTLHGVTRPISLTVTAIGQGPDPWGGYRAGFRATTTLRRTDFGMGHDELGPVADTMKFNLYVEGVRK
jgi:polyisoprenoid-binding protein YceI